ncbi:MAG: glycosyltransferase family 39 protein [Alphaproteobacteria bacterium]
MNSGNNQGFLQRYQTFLLLFLITAAGVFARVHGLGAWDYYHDEIWHVYVAMQPTLADVFYVNLAEDGHPILGYFLWHWLLNIWNDPWMARMPSLITGTLCIPAGYFLGKELFQSRDGGLFAAFFMAFSCLMIEQSNVVRGYTLMLLFSMLAIWSVYRYKENPKLFYILLYFIFTSLSLLSEFAAAPVVAFTALHLLNSIYRKAPSKILPLILWGGIHLFWLFYLWQFTGLLKSIGGIDFTQSHIFFNRDTEPLIHTLAKIVTFFLEYINIAGFFWFIGGAMQSEMLIVIPLLALLFLSIVGVVALSRLRAVDIMMLIIIIVTVTIAFYWFRIVPLSSPRRNIAMLLVFMVLFYYGIRHCAVYVGKYPQLGNLSVVLVLSISTAMLSFGYYMQGEHWRQLRLTEFQQTRIQTDEMLQILEHKVGNNDVVITDLSSAYHLWTKGEHLKYQLLTKHLATFPDYKPRMMISPSDLRMKAFLMDPREVQVMFQEMHRLGMLNGVQNVWILGLQHTNVKTIVIDPTYRNYLNIIIPAAVRARYPQDMQNIVDVQEKLANELYAAARFKKMGFAFSCDNPEPVQAGKEHPCVMNSALFKFPVKTIYEKFIDAPNYQDPEEFLKKVRRELISVH